MAKHIPVQTAVSGYEEPQMSKKLTQQIIHPSEDLQNGLIGHNNQTQHNQIATANFVLIQFALGEKYIKD